MPVTDINKISKIIEDQLLRSSFSAAANYRAACKAISKKADIIVFIIIKILDDKKHSY